MLGIPLSQYFDELVFVFNGDFGDNFFQMRYIAKLAFKVHVWKLFP